VAHTKSESHSASSNAIPGGGTFSTSGVPAPGTPTTPRIPTTPRTSVYTPPPRPTTHVYTPPASMNPTLINDALESYFNGFLYHNTGEVRQATCPKFVANVQGTYINGNEIYRWQSRSYNITPGAREVSIYVAADLRDPNTGAGAGSYNHVWAVQELSNGHYYVCGYYS
jgi:hypothetical protein